MSHALPKILQLNVLECSLKKNYDEAVSTEGEAFELIVGKFPGEIKVWVLLDTSLIDELAAL